MSTKRGAKSALSPGKSPNKSPASSHQKLNKSDASSTISHPIHSTPLPSSAKDKEDLDSSSSLPNASPILERKSGRARKKTEKGAAFDESVKKKSSSSEEHTESVECLKKSSSEASDPSCSAIQSPSKDGSISGPVSSRKRGRPKKSEIDEAELIRKESSERSSNSTDGSGKGGKTGSSRKPETKVGDGKATESSGYNGSTVDDSVDCSENVSSSPSKQNRTPDSAVDTKISETVRTECERTADKSEKGTKKKKGRPRKWETTDSTVNFNERTEQSASKPTDESEWTIQVSRRGRRPKSATNAPNLEPDESVDRSIDSSCLIQNDRAAPSLSEDSTKQSSTMPNVSNPINKRGQGRSRKLKVVVQEESVEITTTSSMDASALDDSLVTDSLHHSGKVDRQIEGEETGDKSADRTQNTTMETTTLEESQPVSKWKRGRPKKQKPLVSETDSSLQGGSGVLQKKFHKEEEKEEEEQRKSSRQRKTAAWDKELEEDKEEKGRTKNSPSKRKRRSKSATTSHQADEEEEQKGEENESTKDEDTKRGGRQSRNTSAHQQLRNEEEEREESMEDDGGRRRNRPSSSSAIDLQAEKDDYEGETDVEEEEEEEKVVKKKRGKLSKTKKEEKDKFHKTSVIEKCLRCGEKMRSLSSYQLHLAFTHAVLYTEECPEGSQTPSAVGQLFKRYKRIPCPQCAKPFNFAQYFLHHLKWCGREDEKEVCPKCQRVFKSMWMQQHERDHRKKDAQREAVKKEEAKMEEQGEDTPGSNKRKAAAASILKMKAVAQEEKDDIFKTRKNVSKQGDADFTRDAADDNDDGDDDDDDDDDDFLEDNELDEERESLSHLDYRRFERLLPDFFDKHHKFLESLPKRKLFPSLLPHTAEWTPLTESESAPYLPRTRESVPVSIKRPNGELTDPTPLQWGESICDDKQGTAFVGGTVWSAEWCPLDDDDGGGSSSSGGVSHRHQMLAVSASRAVWSDWFLFQRGEGPGLIQFYTTGPLDQSPDGGPRLKPSFCVAHDFLHVLSMDWCPRSAYLPCPSSLESKDDVLPRQGLLALAGCDSHVYVYSVPTPEALEGKNGSENGGTTSTPPSSPPVFKPTPTLTLLCSSPEMAGACLSVAWQKGNNCDLIAGGYAKGFIHLWHVSSAPASKRREDGTSDATTNTTNNTLAAVRCFYAHFGVLCVAWGWVTPSLFVTGNVENQVRLWDVRDTRSPKLHFADNIIWEKGPTRAVSFGSSLEAFDFLLFADDQRDILTGGVYALDMGISFSKDFAIKKPIRYVARHAASVWDIDYTPWFNMVASSDSTGLVSVSTCNRIHKHNVKGHTRSHLGVPVFSTTCTRNVEAHKADDSNQEKDTSRDDEITSAEGLCIIFSDEDMEKKKDFMHTEKDEAASRQNLRAFRAADVYTVNFNPNRRHSRWLVCGTRAGFVRILHLPCLAHCSHTALRTFSNRK